MPSKNVKSAKKLYAKMKKEQKKLDAEEPKSLDPEEYAEDINDGEHSNSVPIESEENPKEQQTNEIEDLDNKAKEEKEVKEKAARQKEAMEREKREKETKLIEAQEAFEKEAEVARKKKTQEALEKKADEARNVSEKEASEKEASEKASIAIEAVHSSANYSQSSGRPEDNELIASLRQENADLKDYIKKLESKMSRLESEANAARNNELSMSPSPKLHANYEHSHSRIRSSSFVEAVLYSEAEKVSARNEQMERWEGYQVDLRSWNTRRSFGPIVII